MSNYEIHLTVPVRQDEAGMDAFRQACKEIGVKPIVVLAEPLVDVMTSFRMKADMNSEVFKEVDRQVSMLTERGFHVIRVKVETDLRNPAAWDPLPNQYFESHVPVWISDDQLPDLKQLAQGLDFHVSRNAFKEPVDGRHIRMITVRQYRTTSEKFERRVKALRNVLPVEGYELAKGEEIEFAIYDSNAGHDHAWLQSRGF